MSLKNVSLAQVPEEPNLCRTIQARSASLQALSDRHMHSFLSTLLFLKMQLLCSNPNVLKDSGFHSVLGNQT